MNKGEKMKIKSEYKNKIAKKLFDVAWNDVGSSGMDFDSFRFAAALIEANDFKGLYAIMGNMDSIPREYIYKLLPIAKQKEYQQEVGY
jgi:hypothetical protein